MRFATCSRSSDVAWRKRSAASRRSARDDAGADAAGAEAIGRRVYRGGPGPPGQTVQARARDDLGVERLHARVAF